MLILCNMINQISIPLISIKEVITEKPVCNIITLKTFNLIANNLHCSTHCVGDGGDLLFKITSFFYTNVSEKSVHCAYYL